MSTMTDSEMIEYLMKELAKLRKDFEEYKQQHSMATHDRGEPVSRQVPRGL